MRSRRSSRIELSPIKEIEIEAARLPGVVSLAQGIPSFDTPPEIREYVKRKLDRGEGSKYSLSPGLIELRELVAESLATDGMRYDPDGEILITAGSIEAISSTLIALTEPGQEVLVPSPCYPSYQQAIRIAGCEPRFIPLDEESNFDLDVEAIARQISPRTAAIFYCNPNNPTGTIYSRAQSLRMMELAERHGLLIITDEVYKDFLFCDEPYFTPAQVDAARGRVVRIFSFSKAYAMTGWRVGYLHTARELASEILKVHDTLVTCAPVISQHAAVAALTVGAEAIARARATYLRRRQLTLAQLDELSHVFDYQRPNGAYFVFPRIKDTVPDCADSRRLAYRLLHEARVALVPGSAFGPTGESHLRISFSREDEEIERAFARLRDFFQQQQGRGRRRPPTGPLTLPAPAATWRAVGRDLGTRFLQLWAKVYLSRRRPLVIAIAGFRGKTVIKRLVSNLLKRSRPTRATPRSYNTEIGLPLGVLGLEIDPRSLAQVARTLARAPGRALLEHEPLEALVLELGARRPGDMQALLEIVEPDWTIVTPIADLGQESREALAALRAEIALLLSRVPAEQVLLCTDDPYLQKLRPGSGPLDLTRARLMSEPDGAGPAELVGNQGRYAVGPQLAGDSALYALQAAVLLGEALQIERSEIERFIAEETGERAAKR